MQIYKYIYYISGVFLENLKIGNIKWKYINKCVYLYIIFLFPLEDLKLGGKKFAVIISSVQFSAQSLPTLYNPMDSSMPGLPVHHQLQLNSCWAYWNSCPSRQWCHPTISSSVIPFSSHLQSFPASGSFQMSRFFTSGGQSIVVSASASVLPKNIQDWFPLRCTGWISLKSNGLSRVFLNSTV